MLKDKFKSLIESEKEVDNKKKVENLVVFVVILIITIIAINFIWNKDSSASKDSTNTTNKNLATTENQTTLIDNEYNSTNLEENLESILSSMNGVGKVKVFINYSESSTVEAMYNETTKESSTEETDTSGGVRTIQQTDTQKDVIYSEDSREQNTSYAKSYKPYNRGSDNYSTRCK